MMKKLQKLLLEQSTWTELSDDEQKRFKNLTDIQVLAYFRRQSPPKAARKVGGKWQTIDLNSVPTVTPTPTPSVPVTVSFSKYVGRYDGESILPEFSIMEDAGKLYIITAIGRGEIMNTSGNQFKGLLNGVTYELNFTETNGEVSGGTAKIGPISMNFTKKASSPTVTPPPISSDLNWMLIAKETWDALKKAGYWVKEEGGKLWAAIQNGMHVKEDDRNYKCIDEYMLSHGFFRTLRGSDGEKTWRYVPVKDKLDDKKVYMVFHSDGKFELRYQDGFKIVPGWEAKWECGSDDKSFAVKWPDGRVDTYGDYVSLPGITSTTQTSTDGTSTATGQPIKSFSQVCSAVLRCPKYEDVELGKKFYKICMKCDEIEELQKVSPLFQQLYFDLLKENGKKQQADKYFGPIMQAALRNFQETLGVKQDEWGMIGKETLGYLLKKPEEQKTTTTTTQTVTAPKYELTQDKMITNKTKF